MFQSSPAPEGECNAPKGCSACRSRGSRFQSSPAPEGECNVRRPGTANAGRCEAECFNPHPPLRASATAQCSSEALSGRTAVGTKFQSSPAPEGECNVLVWRHPDRCGKTVIEGSTGFNPHPPLRASATGRRVLALQFPRRRFQSSPAPEGECNGVGVRRSPPSFRPFDPNLGSSAPHAGDRKPFCSGPCPF